MMEHLTVGPYAIDGGTIRDTRTGQIVSRAPSVGAAIVFARQLCWDEGIEPVMTTPGVSFVARTIRATTQAVALTARHPTLGERLVWLPKSQIVSRRPARNGRDVLELTRWLYREKVKRLTDVGWRIE